MEHSSPSHATDWVAKVPQVTAVFWVVKVLATTIGETGGDALSLTLRMGFGRSSLVLFGCLFVLLTAQFLTKRFHPFLYWTTVVATTTTGTTVADLLVHRVMGRAEAVICLSLILGTVLWMSRRTTGRVRFEGPMLRGEECVYWTAICLSNTLGTALGDWIANDLGMGYGGAILFFLGLLAFIAILYFTTWQIPRAALFWAAFVLTRPLGTTLGDRLTMSPVDGGLGLERIAASLVLAGCMVIGIFWFMRHHPQRSNAE